MNNRERETEKEERGEGKLSPGRVDECLVDEELVKPQPGGFYGGWALELLVESMPN